jgi:polysaccharide export outer membrane protein
MGRTIPLFLLRASSILIAGMLLFAVFGHAHAENLDGYGLKTPDAADASDAGYGLKPLPGGPIPGAVAANNNSYNAAPVGGGYNPPSGYGYVPAPSGPVAAPAQQYAAATQQPAPYQAPPPQGAYGYKPAMPYTQPSYPAYPTAPMATPQSNGYYQTLNAPQPQQPPQQSAFGYKPGDGVPSYSVGGGAGYLPGYVLGPGDKIKLTVFGETDLSGDFTIDGTGNLALPLVGQVRAAGYNGPQLEQAIGSAFAQGYLKSPRVSVEVATYRPFYIIGAVNRPGEYPYVNHMNAMNAIALAGGFTNSAVESTIFVRREGSNEEVSVPVDRTTQIYPGDVIKVHNTIFYDAMSWLSPLSGPAFAAAATIH